MVLNLAFLLSVNVRPESVAFVLVQNAHLISYR